MFDRKVVAQYYNTDWIEESLQWLIDQGDDLNSVATFDKLMGGPAYYAPLLHEVAAATTRHLDICFGAMIIGVLQKYGVDFTNANKSVDPLWHFLSAVDIEEQRDDLKPVGHALIQGGADLLSLFDDHPASGLYENLLDNGQSDLASLFSPRMEAFLRGQALAQSTPAASAPSRGPRL